MNRPICLHVCIFKWRFVVGILLLFGNRKARRWGYYWSWLVTRSKRKGHMLPCPSKGRDRRKELRGTLGKDPCLALPGKAVGLRLVRTDDASKFGVRHSLQLSHSWSQCNEDRRTRKAQNTKQFGRWWASGLLVDICKWLRSDHMTSGQTWLSLGELVSSSIWKATGIRIRNAESRDVSNAVCAHICICSHTGRSMSAWWRRIYVYSLRRLFWLVAIPYKETF